MAKTFTAGTIQWIPELAKSPIKEWKKHWKTAIDAHLKNLKERKKHG